MTASRPAWRALPAALPGTGVLTTTSVNLAADPDFVRRPGGDPNLIAKG